MHIWLTFSVPYIFSEWGTKCQLHAYWKWALSCNDIKIKKNMLNYLVLNKSQTYSYQIVLNELFTILCKLKPSLPNTMVSLYYCLYLIGDGFPSPPPPLVCQYQHFPPPSLIPLSVNVSICTPPPLLARQFCQHI